MRLEWRTCRAARSKLVKTTKELRMRIKYEIIYLFLFCVAVEYITTGGTEQTRASLS